LRFDDLRDGSELVHDYMDDVREAGITRRTPAMAFEFT
jgi:hypothetical protein